MYASHFICFIFNPHSIRKFCLHFTNDFEHVKITCLDCTSLVFNCSRVIRGIFQVQFSSVAQSCAILCDPMDYSTPGFPVRHQLPELAQIHVRRVSDAIQIFCGPLHLLPSVLVASGSFPVSRSSHQVAKVLDFISPSVLPMNIQD